MLLPPPCCCVRRRVAIKLPPPPLPPHRRCRRRRCQAATATKLCHSPLSRLRDRFDDEKEFCKMTDDDFFKLSHLLWLGVEFLHRGVLPIFNALVYLSLNHNNL
jgi:hypothetical protein